MTSTPNQERRDPPGTLQNLTVLGLVHEHECLLLQVLERLDRTAYIVLTEWRYPDIARIVLAREWDEDTWTAERVVQCRWLREDCEREINRHAPTGMIYGMLRMYYAPDQYDAAQPLASGEWGWIERG